MLNFIRGILRPKYKPFNLIEIFSQNILDNYKFLKTLQPQAQIFPVLKSNAYGHGLKEMCQILEKTDAPFLAMDSFPEAQIAYKYSNKKILILSQMAPGAYKYCHAKRTEFCVYNLDTLKLLAQLNKKIKVHLFINTGMNREGIQDLQTFLDSARAYLDKVEITGLCSHLASADIISELNQIQQERFFKNLDILYQNKIYPRWVHLGQSWGAFVLRNKRLNALRIGAALYGYNLFNESHPEFKKAEKLKPALRLSSQIVDIQNLKTGDKVSYSERFTAKKPTRIAIIPLGYYEGLDRRLSNQAKFLVISKNKSFYAPIAGNVCMNLTCLDCGQNKVQIGDKVEIISEKKDSPNSIQNLAKIMHTLAYEVLVKLQGDRLIRRKII